MDDFKRCKKLEMFPIFWANAFLQQIATSLNGR